MKKSTTYLAGLLLLGLGTAQSAQAGGCAPGQECWEDDTPVVTRPARRAPKPAAEPYIEKRMPVAEPAPIIEEEPVVMEESSLDLGFGLAAGVNVLYFDCEDTSIAPGIYADFRPSRDLPLNIRLGVEGTKIGNADQFEFRENTVFAGSKPDINFIRVPLSLEYVIEASEKTNIFIGGGPDLVDLSDDFEDTAVGLHLGARVQQNFTENFGLSVGAGYLSVEADDNDSSENIDLDSAYTGAHLTLAF